MRSSSLDIGLSVDSEQGAQASWTPPRTDARVPPPSDLGNPSLAMEARPPPIPRDVESVLAAASAAAGIGRVSSRASLTSLGVPHAPEADARPPSPRPSGDRIRSSFSSHEQSLHASARGSAGGRARSHSSASNAQSELARAAAAEAATQRAVAAITGSSAHEHFTRTLAEDELAGDEEGGENPDMTELEQDGSSSPTKEEQHSWLSSIREAVSAGRDALRRGSAPPLPSRRAQN